MPHRAGGAQRRTNEVEIAQRMGTVDRVGHRGENANAEEPFKCVHWGGRSFLQRRQDAKGDCGEPAAVSFSESRVRLPRRMGRRVTPELRERKPWRGFGGMRACAARGRRVAGGQESRSSRSSRLRSRIRLLSSPRMASASSRLVCCNSRTFSSTVPRAMMR